MPIETVMKKIGSMMLLGALLLAPATGWCSLWLGHHDKLEVKLSVTDAQGKPIPYPTIWEYVLPSANPLALDRDDLWRLTTRYRDSFDFASPFHTIVPCLWIPPMGDASGHVRVEVDYSYLEGNEAPRPALMQVGYTVMKRGYLPGRIDFTVHDESHVEGKVVLQRDPEHAPETQPYMQTYERIRAELSDTRRNEQMTASNAQREQHLRDELEAAAEQAVAAGDKSAAARIYYRMQWLPSVTYINGRIAGWGQSDFGSQQSQAYRNRSCSLDAISNPMIAVGCIHGSRASFFMALGHQLRLHGDEIWPRYHELYADQYLESKDTNEKAIRIKLIKELQEYEPKYKTSSDLMWTPL